MEKRLERIKALIKDESIVIKSDELYGALLDAISQEKFDLHVDAIKAMAIDGHKYTLETVKDNDGFLSLKVFDETTGKTSEDEVPAKEVAPAAPEAKSEPAVTPEPVVPQKEEPKEEPKAEPEQKKAEEIPATPAPVVASVPEVKAEDIATLKAQLAALLEAVSGGNKQVESFKTAVDTQFKQFTENLTDLKKKTKDLQDSQYVSKQLGEVRRKKSIINETDIWEGLVPDNLKQ